MNSYEHVQDEFLEAYTMGRLQAEEIDRFEDHLLLCETCRRRLVDTEEYVRATRVAALRIRAAEAARETEKPSWTAALAGWLFRPQFALAGVAALAAILATPVLLRQAPYAEANLTTVRGVESGPVLAAGTRLQLRLDLRGVEPLPSYQVAVVSTEGRTIALRTARHESAAGTALVVPVDQKLEAGQYWVRLKTPDTSGRLLREYPLRIGPAGGRR